MPALVSTYNAHELNKQFYEAMHQMYPQFTSLGVILTGQPGTGKSTVAASVPVAGEYKRLVLDLEDSMAFLDAGVDGQDIYTPLRHSFAMKRMKFPDMPQFLSAYRAIAHPEKNKDQKNKYGALIIDNIAVMQDIIVRWIRTHAGEPRLVRDMWDEFDAGNTLTKSDKTLGNYAAMPDPSIWSAVKGIVASMLLACKKSSVNFIGTTEMANVWENYNQPGAKIKGQKAKVWNTWLQYTDFIIVLSRDVNSHEPPTASLSPFQPKIRLQGMNPKWIMDWPNFVKEIELSATRTEVTIPEEAKVKLENLTEGDSVSEEELPPWEEPKKGKETETEPEVL